MDEVGYFLFQQTLYIYKTESLSYFISVSNFAGN